MEQQPPQPIGGNHDPNIINSYGTDDPERQAHIENARIDAVRERKRDRENLEHLVELGMSPDDAEAFIEFEHFVQGQVQERLPRPQPEELNVGSNDEAEPGDEEIRRYKPRIYVSDLASHEQGLVHGQWIDATREPDELNIDIAAMLDNSPMSEPKGWMVQACEDFAGLDLHGFTDTALISRMARGVAEHGAAYATYVGIVGITDPDLLDQFSNLYVGSFDSPEAWARSFGESLNWDRHLDDAVDPMLRPYVTIDYQHFASDARSNWDMAEGHDGKTHVFFR